MRALQFLDWKAPPAIADVPRPTPDAGEVLVQVGGAGLCHSDLHVMEEFGAGQLPWHLPFTMGHENAGWVAEVGFGVRGWEVGQPVAVLGHWSCGSCGHCLAGFENYCEERGASRGTPSGGGLGLDGGLAEYLLVPAARHLVALPDGLEPRRAAVLTDAALTPYHAIRRSLPKLVAGRTALVIGAGGLGNHAVQLLKATCAARVLVIEPRETARLAAEQVGADATLAPGPRVVEEIRGLTGGRGADVVLDFVGSDGTLATAMACSKVLGDLTIVGIAGGTAPVSHRSVPYELSVQTTYWGSRAELVEVLALAARGLVYSQIEEFTLDDALTGYERLAAGQIQGRAVVVPSSTFLQGE